MVILKGIRHGIGQQGGGDGLLAFGRDIDEMCCGNVVAAHAFLETFPGLIEWRGAGPQHGEQGGAQFAKDRAAALVGVKFDHGADLGVAQGEIQDGATAQELGLGCIVVDIPVAALLVGPLKAHNAGRVSLDQDTGRTAVDAGLTHVANETQGGADDDERDNDPDTPLQYAEVVGQDREILLRGGGGRTGHAVWRGRVGHVLFFLAGPTGGEAWGRA